MPLYALKGGRLYAGHGQYGSSMTPFPIWNRSSHAARQNKVVTSRLHAIRDRTDR